MTKSLLLLIFLKIVSSRLGADIFTLASSSQLQCLSRANRTFAIVKAYYPMSGFDPDAPTTLKTAVHLNWSINNLGVYILPCIGGEVQPQAQVQETVRKLEQASAPYSEFYIQVRYITGATCNWGRSYDLNCLILQRMVMAAQKSGKKVGIHVSPKDWVTIMGGDYRCAKFMDLPLWYTLLSGQEGYNFDDYRPFGGWQKPTMKTYYNPGGMCFLAALASTFRE